jgi:hypothetical protein
MTCQTLTYGVSCANIHVVMGSNCCHANRNTYSKPMCEWTIRSAQKSESATGFSDPAAKGAMVTGMRAAEMIL